MCCSSCSPAAQSAQSYSAAAVLKAAQNPAAAQIKFAPTDIGKQAAGAGKAPGTGLHVDKSA